MVDIEEKDCLKLFVLNPIFLVAVTLGSFGFFSFWVAVIVWFFSIALFGRCFRVYGKDIRSAVEIWRFLTYCLIFITSFACYNFSFWWWLGFGGFKNSFAFNNDTVFVAFCITVAAICVFEGSVFLLKERRFVDVGLAGALKRHRELICIVGIILAVIFYLGWALFGLGLGFVWTNLYIPFSFFFLVTWCLSKKLHDKTYQKALLAIFFICTVVFAGVAAKNAYRSKIGEAFVSSKGEKVLSKGWWVDQNNKKYFLIHHRWNDSVFVNLDEKHFYKCLVVDDSLRNCQLINGVLPQDSVA